MCVVCMQSSIDTIINPQISVPLSHYVSIPSLACAENLYAVLDKVSFFASPIKNGMQIVNLQYTEWSSLYTLWRYTLAYDTDLATLSHFATANLRWLKPAYKQHSHFASKTHLLRTPVSWLWSTLFKHVIDSVKQQNIPCLKISSDATSVPFYIKMCQKFSDYFSHIDKNYTRYSDGWCDFHFTFK